MGTTNSKTPKQYKVQHPKFQAVKVLNEEEVQIQVRTTLDDFNSWKSNLKKISSFNKQNILFPLNYTYEEQGWCAQNTGTVKVTNTLFQITYDNYQFVFEEQLQNRINLERHLSEQEMWYLLYTLVSTAKDFSFLNRKVGDIRPHNIFVSQAGQIKVAVCFSWPNQPNNYEKTLNNNQITYLSPEELQVCKNNKIQSLINPIVAESFSIGLTMLHSGLLFNGVSIYNLQKFQINRKLLEQKVNTWMNLQFVDQNNNKASYSTALRQIVRNLCILDPQKRQLSTEIFTILQPYKEAILNIEPFHLNYRTDLRKSDQRTLNPLQLQKSKGLQVFNYTQASKSAVVSNQTPYGVSPNLDWSRMFSQIPSNNNTAGQSNFHHESFYKYANSTNSANKSDPLNMKLANTINQKQSFGERPSYMTNSSYTTPGVITVRPFNGIHQQQPISIFKPITIHHTQLQTHIQKKVQSRDFIHIPQPILKQKQVSNQNKIQAWKVGLDDSSDFLRKIDEQLQKSKAMFPS